MWMKRHGRLLVLATMAAVAAVVLWPRLPRVAGRALATADRYELLSIEPERADPPSAGDFHRHRVLGRTPVADPAVRRRLEAALRAGVAPVYTSRPKCFSPRLGIRVVAADGRATDFVICFGCQQAQVWEGDRLVADWTTDRTPKAAFDQVLQTAGVPLPPDDDE